MGSGVMPVTSSSVESVARTSSPLVQVPRSTGHSSIKQPGHQVSQQNKMERGDFRNQREIWCSSTLQARRVNKSNSDCSAVEVPSLSCNGSHGGVIVLPARRLDHGRGAGVRLYIGSCSTTSPQLIIYGSLRVSARNLLNAMYGVGHCWAKTRQQPPRARVVSKTCTVGTSETVQGAQWLPLGTQLNGLS